MGLEAHLLVVDDDLRLADLLSRYLRRNGFAVSVAADSAEARERLRQFVFDLVVLDVMLPDRDGFALAREIRSRSDVPILFLTARGEPQDRIAGLETGADDYLVKPFEPRELLLRISTILRRSRRGGRPGTLRFGPWSFDPELAELRHEERGAVRLTAAESSLLAVLARAPGRVFSREQLAAESRISGSERAIDVQMARLRRKLGEDPREPRWLLTVRGEGYLLRTGG
ncbi:Transcriptional regulatory protein OmpR [bacterium HR40]|nr:Transcriptional regulatory protein OmpR [bacterium HR40]